MREKKSAPLGASLVAISSVFYACYGIWTKLMGNFFGGYTASSWRSVLVLLLLLPFAGFGRDIWGFQLRRNWRYFAIVLAASIVMWGPFYYAILHAGIGVAVSLNYATYVIGMFVFGWLFMGERFTRDKWLATILSFGGLYLVFTPSLAGAGWLALAGATISGFGFAAVSSVVKCVPYGVMQSTVFLWVGSLVANFTMAAVVGEKSPDFGWHVQWFFLLLFAATSVLASLLYIKGLKMIEAGAAGILGLLEIVFAAIFGAVFFGERVGIMAAAGIALIIAAAAIPYVKDYNAQRGTLAEPKS